MISTSLAGVSALYALKTKGLAIFPCLGMIHLEAKLLDAIDSSIVRSMEAPKYDVLLSVIFGLRCDCCPKVLVCLVN